jgi:predicted ArsR family transcriptional regulator
MMYDYNQDQRFHHIEILLGYPKVGPLSLAAIAINLGADENTIRPDLAALVDQGRIVRRRDGRFTVPGYLEMREAHVSRHPVGKDEAT